MKRIFCSLARSAPMTMQSIFLRFFHSLTDNNPPFFSYNMVSTYKEISMEKLMEIKHVGYSYHSMQGETPALSNINFTVHKGDFLAIVGPSGCGNAMV